MRIHRRSARLFIMGSVGVMASIAPHRSYAQGGPFADIQNRLATISTQLNELTTISTQLNQLAALAAQIEALQQQTLLTAKAADQYVPFKVQIPGGLCDSGLPRTSNPEIVIDSDGTDSFVVTSILVRRGFMNPVDFMFLGLNTVRIDGTPFDTRAGNLLHPIGGEFGVQQAVDLLGTPVRPHLDDQLEGGNVPHQIVAEGDGPEDIHLRLFCRSDLRDMTIDTVLVAGWKKPGDTISVSYRPGQ